MKVALIATDLRAEDAYRFPSEYLFRKSGGNTGNFAYVQALWNHLSPHVEIFPWHASPESIRETSEVVVIACANQMGPHTDLGTPAQTLDKVGLPILAVGLGAQAATTEAKVELNAGTKRWLDVIAAHAPTKAANIGVRGEFSRRQVEENGNRDRAVVTGCPSNFLNPDRMLPRILDHRRQSESLDRVGVAAGLFHWTKLATVEQSLADLLESTSGLYIAQSEINMIRTARGEWDRIAPATLETIRKYIRPNLSDEDFRVWCKRYAACFIDADSWMEAMRNFDFVVGPRFHGVMLAMQAGTPGGVIAHDSRTFEMCETMAIPVRMFQDMPPNFGASDLRSLFNFDAADYARKRHELASRYVDMLTAAGIVPHPSLQDLRRSDEVVAPQSSAPQRAKELATAS